MKRIIICVFAFVTVSLGVHFVSASEPEVIAWKDLVPDESVPDPFAKLSQEQLQDLGFAVRVRSLIAADKIRPDGPDAKEADEIVQRLRKSGIDIPWLLAQSRAVRKLRELQANAVEPSLDGKYVTSVGYVIPVRIKKGRLIEFLLVPSVDACSHATPPPPNQIIYVQLRKGIDRVDRQSPVLVTGRMKTHSSTRKLLRGSGPRDVTAAYAISADTINVYSGPVK
jgi:hypothetical protein